MSIFYAGSCNVCATGIYEKIQQYSCRVCGQVTAFSERQKKAYCPACGLLLFDSETKPLPAVSAKIGPQL